MLAAIAASREIARTRGLTDVEAHLTRVERNVRDTEFTAVIVGEFKRGKSTLINALLQAAVCPVDADIVTAVPTMVRYAPKLRIKTIVRDPDGSLREREIPVSELQDMVTEQADPADPERERSVEVGLPHRILRAGLRLLDTPGVGGLDSAHGFLTLGALRHADAVVFVTDAAQELTGPELAFLRRAVQQCPLAAVVITKIDLYPQWRRIVELNRGHLGRAGIELPIIPVSSFLRLRAQHEPALNEESGFADLVSFLARDVVAHCRKTALTAAAADFDFAATQLAQQSAAERVVIAQPEKRMEVVAQLDAAKRKAERLADPTATWQKLLRDGIQDMYRDVQFDLQRGLRTVRTDAEAVVQQGDPQTTWAETEVWLRRQVAMVAAQNSDLLTTRANDLATAVAEQFDMQAGTEIGLRLQLNPDLLSQVTFAPRSSLSQPGGKLAPIVAAARTGAAAPAIGVTLIHLLTAGAIATVAIGGLAVVLGAGIGAKIIKDERTRQRTYRQQQAKTNIARFVDEVAFLMNKQTDDALRATERELRDEFERRALMLQNSASAAIHAVERVSELEGSKLEARRNELANQDRRLGEARAAARDLSAREPEPARVGARG